MIDVSNEKPWRRVAEDRIKKISVSASYFADLLEQIPEDEIKRQVTWELASDIAAKLMEFNKVVKSSEGNTTTYRACFEVIMPR